MADNIAENEYSILHYGFSPEMFFKEFSDTVLGEMAVIVQQSMKHLSSPSCPVRNNDELIKKFLPIHDIWSQRTEVILQKLKPTINEFFTIPKNVLLPDDQIHESQYSEEEVRKLEEEVKGLEEKYRNDVNATKLMKAEIAVIEKLEPIQKMVDEAADAVHRFQGTLNGIKELEKLAEAHKDYKNLIAGTGNDTGEDEILKHPWKFKTG